MPDDILRHIARESTDGTLPRPTIPGFLAWLDNAPVSSFQNPDGSWSHVFSFGHALSNVQVFARQRHDAALWQERALDKATRRAIRLWALVGRGVLTDAEYRQVMQAIRRRYRIEG